MNRASGYGKNGEMSILAAAKESGNIDYSADVVMGIVDDPSNRRTTSEFLKPRLLRIDKNRIGEVKVINLDWYAERQQFTEAPER
jgi:replicative DNA helicase